LFFARFFSVFSQNTGNNHFPVSIVYGSKFLGSNLNNQLNSTGHFKVNGPVSMAGICITGYQIYGLGNTLIHEADLYYAQVLPADLQLSDTVSAGVSGFQFGASLLGYDHISKKNRRNRVGFSIGLTPAG